MVIQLDWELIQPKPFHHLSLQDIWNDQLYVHTTPHVLLWDASNLTCFEVFLKLDESLHELKMNESLWHMVYDTCSKSVFVYIHLCDCVVSTQSFDNVHNNSSMYRIRYIALKSMS